jgi:hypothetical protein
MPSALAVVRLMTRSNLVGCSTGISAGCAPRRILFTNSAARRNKSGKLAPAELDAVRQEIDRAQENLSAIKRELATSRGNVPEAPPPSAP